MTEDPVLVDSGLSQEIEVDGFWFDILIYRLEEETTWTLEVVDEDSTSQVWDETFTSDFAALVAAQKAIWLRCPALPCPPYWSMSGSDGMLTGTLCEMDMKTWLPSKRPSVIASIAKSVVLPVARAGMTTKPASSRS